MPRKFKLCKKKNDERKKYQVTSLMISIPLSVVSTKDATQQYPISHPLTLSLPLTFYINLPLNSLSTLHSRLKMMPQLLNGWIDATSCPSELTICRLQQTGPCPSVLFTVTIREDLTWQVHYKFIRIEPDSTAFQGIPSVLASLGDISHLISVFDSSKCCIGNPDEKFAPLLSRRESGVFKNKSGKFTVNALS